MRRRVAYCFLLLIAASFVRAQNCGQNMLTIPDVASYGRVKSGLLSLSDTFTIEFWMRGTENSPNAGLFEQGRSGDSGTISIRLTEASEIVCSFAFTGGRESITSPALSLPLSWNHVAVSFTPRDSLRLYINGLLAASRKTSATALRTASGDTITFGYSALTGTAFIGSLDEMRVWSRRRTQSEIAGSRYLGFAGTEQKLAAYWRFDDAAGSLTIHDFTGKGLEGMVVSSALIEPNTSLAVAPLHPGYMLDAIEDEVVMRSISCSQSRDTVIHIRNIGPDTLVIGTPGFRYYNNIFSIRSTLGFPLPPNVPQTALISIQANAPPGFIGEFVDTLLVDANTPCGGRIRIPVRIRIDSVGIRFAEDSVILPKPYLPCQFPFERNVIVRNTGTRDVRVTGALFKNNIGISLSGVSFPFTLAVGEEKKLTLVYEQGNDGRFTDTLQLTTLECQREAILPLSFIRSSISYDLPSTRIDFPITRMTTPPVVIDTQITIYNTGTSEIYISSITPSGEGFLLHPSMVVTSANLYPGDSTIIKIRFQTSRCGTFVGKLTLPHTPQPCPDTIRIPLSIKVVGPEVIPLQTRYDVGSTCTPKDIDISIINRSGVDVTLVDTMFASSSFKFNPPIKFPRILRRDSILNARLKFSPSTPGRHTDTLKIFTNPCGYVAIPLEGYLGVGEVALSDTLVDFGHSCDLGEERRKVKLINTTGKAFSITEAARSGSDAFKFTNSLTLFIAAGDSIELDFAFKPDDFGKYESTFLFTYGPGDCYVASITVRGVRERAALRWATDTLSFGDQCPDSSKQLLGRIRNAGFANYLFTSINVSDPKYFTAPDDLLGTNIAPGTTLDIPVKFTPDSIGPFSALLTVVFAPCRDTLQLILTGSGGPKPELVTTDTLIDFGNVRVGDSAIHCIELQNPSCIPITISAGDIIISPLGVDYYVEDDLQLPYNISAGTPLKLCIVFKPGIADSISGTVVMNVNDTLHRVQLLGKGVRPKLVFAPRIIDFEEVQTGRTSTKGLAITNQGSAISRLQFSTLNSVDGFTYTLPLPDHLDANSSVVLPIDFVPVEQKFYQDTVLVTWDERTDTIVLVGRGVGPGLLFSFSECAKFGDVRLQHDSVVAVRIRGSEEAQYPITIQSSVIAGLDSDLFTIIKTDPTSASLNTDHDSLIYYIRYIPAEEKSNSAYLIIEHSEQFDTLPLCGRGVEAHLRIEDTLIDFGPVPLDQTVQRSFKIYNDGDYPLDISNPPASAIFKYLGAASDAIPIPAKDSAEIFLEFIPTRAISYEELLTIPVDAPEKNASVRLRGKGVFSQGQPDIVYTVAGAQLRVGDIVELPIYVSGNDAGRVEVDSIYLKIKYDPTVAYVHDTIITSATITSGMQTDIEYNYNDSTILVRAYGKAVQFSESILLKLRTEALLGPIDSTRFVVTDASPSSVGDQLLNSGLFYVTDCANYRTNIQFKGPYSISNPTPNPASSTVALNYELGLDAPVRISLIDALGRTVKTVVDRFERRGSHQIVFSVDDLPQGSYIYVISSLEYLESGKLLIGK